MLPGKPTTPEEQMAAFEATIQEAATQEIGTLRRRARALEERTDDEIAALDVDADSRGSAPGAVASESAISKPHAGGSNERRG